MEEITKELQLFDINAVVLAKMRESFMQLRVADVNDSRGFDDVHEARMVVVKTRVKVEKIGLDLRRKKRAEIEEYLKKVSGTEKYIVGELVPIENYLQSEEDIVTNEKARLKAIEEAMEAERLKVRVEGLVALGCHFDGQNYVYGELKAPVPMVKVWGDEEYGKIFDVIKAASDADKAKAAEEADRITNESRKLAIRSKLQSLHEVYVTPSMTSTEIESLAESYKNNIPGEDFQEFAEEALQIYQKTLSSLCKMHGERVEQEHITAEQAAERERLAAEANVLQDERDRLAKEKKEAEDAILREKQAKERAAEIEAAKIAAADKARIETEERIKQETEAKEAKAKAEAEFRAKTEEKARIAAEKKAASAPDKAKILLIADTLDAIQTPDVKTDDGKAVALSVMMSLASLIKIIRDKAETL